MAMPDVGDKAPAFSLEDQSGKTVKLSDFKGRKVVLYFYPKDDTPGCTREACAIRDLHGLWCALANARGAFATLSRETQVPRPGPVVQRHHQVAAQFAPCRGKNDPAGVACTP